MNFGFTTFTLQNRVIIASVFAMVFALQSVQVRADEKSAEQEAREKAFSDKMANTTLVGSFTVDGKSDGEPLKEERYEIESVKSAGGNLWIFLVRVKYGKVDTKLPVTVPVEWAGDTPMVSLTNATLPGLGSEFSARVLFHDDRYAGTWAHGKVGGHMFGRIEKTVKKEEPKAAK